MRTTIVLPDDLAESAKRLALDRGTTFTAVVADALRAALASRSPEHEQSSDPLPTYGDSGLRPGVDLDDSAALRDLLDSA
jgi:hypothetical protein